MASSNTLNKNVSVMPDLANLIRIDHLWLDFTLLTKFERSTILFANYYYNVIYLLEFALPPFKTPIILLEKTKSFPVMEKAKNIWSRTKVYEFDDIQY